MRSINKPRRKFRKGEEVWYDGNPYTVYDARFRNGEWVYDISNDEEGLASFGVSEDELKGKSKEKPTSRSKFRRGQTVWYDGVPCTIDDAYFTYGKWRYNVSNDDEQIASFGATEDELTPCSESTMRKPAMKKLNITKEQFEKSRYFKNKYGKLEYVNESGKVFKTNKGKVLMFKESETSQWIEVDITWGSEDDSLPDTIFVKTITGKMPSRVELECELEETYGDQVLHVDTYPVSEINPSCDCFKCTGDKLKPFDPSRITGKELQANWESTRKFGRKFGRKFSESASIEDEVWDKWERMSDEIISTLNFEEVAKNIAKKYFPRYADKLAIWLNWNIDLICTDGYAEDWTEMENSLESFTRDNHIQISDLA